jgi:hypothetical protein
MFHWSYDWQTESLIQALVDAVETANWPPGRGDQLWGGLRVYEYNQKGDWPPP